MFLVIKLDGDGRTISSSYAGNELVSQTWYNSSSSMVNTLSWTYDDDGNVLTAASFAGTDTKTYLGNQVASEITATGVTLTYGYDENGNMTSIVDSLAGTTSMSYNANRQLLTKTYQDSYGQMRENFTLKLPRKIPRGQFQGVRTRFPRK
jgi:YD repeat-containing protein